MILLIVLFLVCSLGVFFTSYFSIDSIKAISKRFHLSETFIGTSFLAIGTSFPEFINSIVAGFNDRGSSKPNFAMYSFFNITGSNIWQVVFLGFLLGLISGYFFIKKQRSIYTQISNTFWEKNMLSWKIVFFETLFLFFIFIFPNFFAKFNFFNFNLINLPFLFIWIWYMYKTYQEKNPYKEVKINESNSFEKLGKWKLLFVSLFAWGLFGIFSYINFYICTLFEAKINIPGNVALGVILSFVTSMPEFCAFFFLFKKKEYLIGVSGLFGSSLFNLTLPVYTNLISGNPLFGVDLAELNDSGMKVLGTRIVAWLALNMFLNILFLFTFFSKCKYWRVASFFNGIFIVTIYIISTFAISIYL